MFAKLLTLILALGLLAGLLLVNRQRRYEVVGERVRLHAQIEQLKRRVQELKVHVADTTQSTEIEMMVHSIDEKWQSIGMYNESQHALDTSDQRGLEQ